MNFRKRTILGDFPLFERMVTVFSQVQDIVDRKKSIHNATFKPIVLIQISSFFRNSNIAFLV